MSLIFSRLSVLLLPLVLLSGCSSVGEVVTDKKTEYRNQRQMTEDLEIPPDLSRSGINDAMTIPGVSTSYSEFAERREGGSLNSVKLAGNQVLPGVEGIKVMRDGDQHWLLIDSPADEVWPLAVEFWRQAGLLLVEQDPTVGIMQTDWLESRADIKQGFLTELFRKAFDSVYSSATRDQFRVRIEPGEQAGTTELYLTHRGMEEHLKENPGGDSDTTFWTPRPSEPGIEVEMLRRMMIFMGAEQQATERMLAQPQQRKMRSQMVKRDGYAALRINEGFARAWRLVGMALDRVGFAVEDRNRSEGIYFVRYNDPDKAAGQEKGFFSKLAFWTDDEQIDTNNQYRVRLDQQAEVTLVSVENEAGQPESSTTSQRILTLLHEQIR
jgi:outer membrane protein assembly factor BamC